MAEATDRDSILALGELRGLLAAFAWANHKCNHSCTFTVEALPTGPDVHESLTRYFGEWASKVSAVELIDWHAAVEAALRRWLFQFRDLVKPTEVCAFTDERCHRDMVGTIMDAFTAGLQPSEVWRVEIDPRGFYECAWDDFAVRGSAGLFFLHFGVSD
jgi:hypothetical protein